MAGATSRKATVVFAMAILALVVAGQTAEALTCKTKADVNVRHGPSTTFDIITNIPKGTTITVTCGTTGQSINGDNWWLWHPASQGYLSDYYCDCNGVKCPVPSCG